MIDLEDIIDVHFVDNEYTLLEILYENENQETVSMTVNVTDEENPEVKQIMEMFTMEQLIQKTYDYDKSQSTSFKRAVMQIAKEEGQLEGLTDYAEANIADKTPEQISFIIKFFLSYIFGEELPEQLNKETLFSLKLEVFENEVIKKSSKSKTKSLIRKAQTPFEVMKYVIEIIDHENNKKNTTKKT